MANQIQATNSILEEISNLDTTYKKILHLRNAVDEEDKMTVKYTTQLAQAHKSNWKLNAKDESLSDDINLNVETINTDISCIESCKEQAKFFKAEMKHLLDERKDEIDEKIIKLNEKFSNAYNEYDTKNLITSCQEYREKNKKTLQDVNDVTQIERKWREKENGILTNLIGEKVSTVLYDFISTEDSDVLEESQLKKRAIKDAKLKYQQHEETIQEFSKQKSKYNF